MTLNDFGDAMTFLLVPPRDLHLWFSATEWIAVKFGTDIHVVSSKNINLSNTLVYDLFISSSLSLVFLPGKKRS